MRLVRTGMRLSVLAVVTLVGTGACALGSPQAKPDAGGYVPVAVAQIAQKATGASASPGPAKQVTHHRVAAAACPRGPYQKQVEVYLNKFGGFGKLKVDGKQSAADCAAIKKFQKRYGIVPPEGRAGPTTLDVSRRLASTNTKTCIYKATTFCINLTQQTIWVVSGRKVIHRPTVTRTGMPGFRTPAGIFRINFRNVREWSNPYKVWMPYWQHFYGGMGLHQTTTYLHNKPAGSHGCVNLLPVDARAFWKIGRVGMRVHTFGRRAGT